MREIPFYRYWNFVYLLSKILNCSTGNCPFGLRCIFIHDEDERELPNSESFDSEYASRARQRRASEQVSD